MAVTIHELNVSNLVDAGKCESTFMVDSRLIVLFKNGSFSTDTVQVTPYEKQYSREDFSYSDYINNEKNSVFLAYLDDRIAGEARIRQNWNNLAYVEDIVVDARFRKQGIGRALISTVVEWAKERRLAGIMIETQDNNVAACKFYQSCGFEIGGIDKNLYRGLGNIRDEIAIFWYLLFDRQ